MESAGWCTLQSRTMNALQSSSPRRQSSLTHVPVQLLSLRWKVGLAVQSSATRALNRAFVTLEVTTGTTATDASARSIELSVAEFKVRMCVGGVISGNRSWCPRNSKSP